LSTITALTVVGVQNLLVLEDYCIDQRTNIKMKSSMSNDPPRMNGWKAVLGSTVEALALFRISMGALLVCELILRFRFLHVFYSDEG
jgi:hypothetical protein